MVQLHNVNEVSFTLSHFLNTCCIADVIVFLFFFPSSLILFAFTHSCMTTPLEQTSPILLRVLILLLFLENWRASIAGTSTTHGSVSQPVRGKLYCPHHTHFVLLLAHSITDAIFPLSSSFLTLDFDFPLRTHAWRYRLSPVHAHDGVGVTVAKQITHSF